MKHFNIATIVDKNKIASENAFIILMELEVLDPSNNTIVDTIRFTRNSENVVYRGETYQAANFEIDIKIEPNQEPSINVSAQDQTRTLAQYIEAYDGLINNDVKLIIVNSLNIPNSDAPEIEETFKITTASVDNYVVRFDLGTDSAVNQRFPLYRMFKDKCKWRYKDSKCKYAGSLASCDYTLNGPNGCAFHNNTLNFGGEPGLNELF